MVETILDVLNPVDWDKFTLGRRGTVAFSTIGSNQSHIGVLLTDSEEPPFEELEFLHRTGGLIWSRYFDPEKVEIVNDIPLGISMGPSPMTRFRNYSIGTEEYKEAEEILNYFGLH